MLIRVCFNDNDFRNEVYAICEKIMYEIANGYEGKKVFENYEKYKQKLEIENIRKAIVLGAYGQCIVTRATRVYLKMNYEFENQEKIIAYLDENILIEEVKEFNGNDNNYETCYIDFYNLKVWLI